MKIKVGTRGSRLALAQSQAVIFAIQKKFPDLEMELIIIKTRGDLDQKTRLDQMNEKGIFVKEIEEALLNHRIDIAIHSLKDMPSVICEGLLFSTPPKREDPRDVFVVPRRNQEFISFKKGARIGTGSIRRSRQLKEAFPDCEILPIRGNIDTRIQKMLDEDFDGIVLAAAGIHRLNLWESDVYQVLPIEIDQAIPSPCQGILGIQIRNED
ncbi:MAG: hydroxymethylbilane synthase, partial [Vallitaleaceae bacterium]|nr:hydroxymethylbilane synthase [Vallitaleaceae bacterium]